jgi:hypothetical protein
MRGRLAAWALSALASTFATAAVAADATPLRVCLDEDRPPLSAHR